MAQFYTFADSIGGSGQQLANLYQNRDLADQRLLAQRIQQIRDRQAQENFQQQMGERAMQNAQLLAQRNAEFADTSAQRDRAYGLEDRRLKLYENAPSPAAAKAAAAAEKANADAQSFGLAALFEGVKADGTLDESSEAYQKAHPLVQQTILAEALRRRSELKPEYDRRSAGVKFANEAARMEQVAAGIEGDKKENSRQWFNKLNPFSYSQTDPNAADPQAIAKDLRGRALKIRSDYKDLLTDKGLIQDPTTKHYTAKFPSWYQQAAQPRQLNMSTAQAAAPPQGVSLIPDSLLARQVQIPATPSREDLISRRLQIMQEGGAGPIGLPNFDPRPLNIATPQTTTGTNMPPVVQSKMDFDALPSGSLYINANSGQTFQKP